MGDTTQCYWSPTGYARGNADGTCSCAIVAPPDVALSEQELAALTHHRDVLIARTLGNEDELAELLDEDLCIQHTDHLFAAFKKLRNASDGRGPGSDEHG